MEEQFKVSMEKTIAEAKAEIHAHVSHAITQAGIQSINSDLVKLVEKDD